MIEEHITDDALFYISVVEDKGKPPILAEGMEISTRSRGENVLFVVLLIHHYFTSGGDVCRLFIVY